MWSEQNCAYHESGEHRLLACRSRQLAETGEIHLVALKSSVGKCCRQGCRQLQASSLCSPRCVAGGITEHRRCRRANATRSPRSHRPCSRGGTFGLESSRTPDRSPDGVSHEVSLPTLARRCPCCF